ncbi:lysine methyltransferase domain-containing protein [Sarocladium implicatum]|nr:lysine methyltransferase domain-containing protein [Sarocladium implicatum]
MTLAERLTAHLGDPVADYEEETFILYSRPRTTHSLGFIDPKASSVDVVIHGKDYTVHQSPSILSSSRAGVLWAITPLFASWISSPAPSAFLPPATSILELGCGISPLNALAIASPSSSSSSSTTSTTSRRYILTDQPYVSRFIARNIEENEHLLLQPTSSKRSGRGNRANRGGESSAPPWKIEFKPLDWETDTVSGVVEGDAEEAPRGFDLVLACDCVYNEALIEPLVQTCADACALREGVRGGDELQPTACVVAQQLRDDTVFQAWLAAFMGKFEAWRVPDEILPEGLRVEDGFVIYVGLLKR